jgi:hypothetical protein
MAGANALKIVRKYFPNVNHVDDADEVLMIDVTESDDKKAAKMDHTGCAMAVAMKREMHLDGVIMAVTTAYIVKGDRAIRYRVPPRVSREIVSFDRGGHFAPGPYKLDPPDPWHRLGTTSTRSYGPKTGVRPRAHLLTQGVRSALGAKG